MVTYGKSRTQRMSVLTAAVLGLAICNGAARAVDTNTKLDGYRGIWFSIGQANEWGPKYSGGLGTYTANHVPIAIYAPAVDKTFFLYGGVDDATGDLLIMASWYDHATCLVPRPTVVYHKVGINDPHDNGALLIDRDGRLWVFISGRATARPGFIYRSTAPYSTDEFEHVLTDQRTYPQPWYLDDGVTAPVFLHMFTKYTAGRELYWATSTDGVNWSAHQKMAGFGGHYQTSMERGGKIGTAFNYHPGGNVDLRTNLYYMQTTDRGQTWTTVDGTPLTTPLSTVNNPALLVDYQAQGLLCYINDTNLDEQGNPYILYITSQNYAAGPGGDPRTWRLARWTGQQWVYSVVTTGDHNYDVGNLYIEGDTLRILGPTENGPQVYGTGGEVAMWISHDKGATWTRVRDVTTGSLYNHSYVRRPRHARDPFYAFWADGHALMKTDSRLYFCNRAGARVWRLPVSMSGDSARPERITDFGAGSGPLSPLWRSPFETLAAGAVAHGQTITGVRNPAGVSGLAVGASPLTYAAYGQPNAGAAPAAGAGAFAAALPDDRTVAISTTMASDAGNLQNALTFEGFFRTPDAALITSPTFVGRRLVTQKRSGDDGSSRLAIGLHGTTVAGSDGLFDYEGFNYAGAVLQGRSGGIGWGGPWDDSDADFAFLTNDGVSLPSPLFATAGSRISGVNTADGASHEAIRPLSRSLNLTQEGAVLYFSALMKKTAITSPASARNLEIDFTPSSGTQVTRFGMTSGTQFFLNAGANAAGTVMAGTTYLVIGKVLAHSGDDDVFFNYYGPGDNVPTTEPGAWNLTGTITGTNSSATLSHMRVIIGNQLVNGEIDEIRVGNTYAAVTDPNAPIGSGGGQANVLSVFWHDTDAVNHLEFGVTPIQTNTWYHFALVYDGSLLKWYLDGDLEGEVTPTNLIPAGSAVLSIGNNRVSGESDRGFYGVIDEVRISDQALAPASFLLNGGSCDASCGASGGSILWCSGFEAESGFAASHNLADSGVCGAIENIHGRDGTSAGPGLTYVAYGQPGVGSAPGGAAGSFAMALPDDRSAGIDTHLASDAGSLQDEVTFEGFFNTSEVGPITSPASVGRRLVTQKRSALDSESRLAIGLHASGSSNVLGVYWRTQDNQDLQALGVTPIQAGTWHHFALVYDGVEIHWYLDGQLEGQVPGASLAAAGPATIAIGNGRTDGVADRGFYGMLDEIRIVDRALSPAEFLLPVAAPEQEPCYPECRYPFADADADGDVDANDFGAFQRCITGAHPFTASTDSACLCYDRDGSASVDTADLTEFLKCVTGPDVPWTQPLWPACAP